MKMKKDNDNKIIVVKPKKKVNVINMDSIMENIIKKNYYIPNKKIDDEYFNLLK